MIDNEDEYQDINKLAGVNLEELGFDEKKSATQGVNIILHLKNAFGMGGHFENLIDLEDFLEKRLNMKEGLDYNLYCKRSNRPVETPEDKEYRNIINFYITQQLPIDKEIEDVEQEIADLEIYSYQSKNEDITEERKEKLEKQKKLKEKRNQMNPLEDHRSELKKERQKIIDRYEEVLKEIKEIQFIEELGMDKEVAEKLDIRMRKRLEAMFPELEPFYMLVFKPDSSIQRKAFIYHKKENEREYMEVLKNLLNIHNRKFNNELNSMIKISFRGKYIVKVNKQLFQNFKYTIENILFKHKVKSKTVETNLKTELHLQGNESNPRAVQTAYEEIVDLLRAEEFFFEETGPGQGKRDIYQYYALFHSEGDNIIQMLNNNKSGVILIETNYRNKKVTIRGLEKERPLVKDELRNLYF